MQDISLHLLDIIENAVRAESKNIWLTITVNIMKNRLSITLKDDGNGMDDKTQSSALDPFYTSKDRSHTIGLGLPLFKQSAEMCNGSFELFSTPGNGTELRVSFQHDHIDRMPIGNLKSTLLNSIVGHPDIDFHIILQHHSEKNIKRDFTINTPVIRAELGEVPINFPEVVSVLDKMIIEGINTVQMEEY